MPPQTLVISYSHQQKATALKLENIKLTPFYWWKDDRIAGTVDWWANICEAIEEAYCVVVLMSKAYVNSVYCQAEIQYAVQLNKPILCIMLEVDVAYPKILNDRRIQHKEIYKWNKNKAVQIVLEAMHRVEKDYNSNIYPRDFSIRPHLRPPLPNEQNIELAEESNQPNVTKSQKSGWIRPKTWLDTVNKDKILPSDILKILPNPFEWIEIPAGNATFRNTRDFVEGFLIAKYPITTAQYQEFIREKGYSERKWWDDEGWELKERLGWTQPDNQMWRGTKFYDDNRPLPVVGISWHEAVAFCKWLGHTTGDKISLPSNLQWQRAAQGDGERLYPWGNHWDIARCNNNIDAKGIRKTSPVNQYETLGASPFGVVDMVGNVEEWCITPYSAKHTNGLPFFVLRGGSFYRNNPDDFRLDKLFAEETYTRKQHIGFRIVRSLVRADDSVIDSRNPDYDPDPRSGVGTNNMPA